VKIVLIYQQTTVGSRPKTKQLISIKPHGDSNLFMRMCLKNNFLFLLGQLFTVDKYRNIVLDYYLTFVLAEFGLV